jgi:transporter family-2 protein
MANTLLVLIAISGGIAVTLQGQFMGLMVQNIGTKESVFITYTSGSLIMTLVMLASHWGNLRAWQGIPWYAFSSGILGLVIVSAIGYVVPRLGLANGFTLIVASQFILAVFIDQFGLFGAIERTLDLTRFLGLGLLLSGVWLIIR